MIEYKCKTYFPTYNLEYVIKYSIHNYYWILIEFNKTKKAV